MEVLNHPSGFPDWGSNKGTGNPQESWPWRPPGLDYRTSTRLAETDSSLGGHKQILCTPSPRGKEQWPHRRLNQNYLQVLEGLLWRCGLARVHHREIASLVSQTVENLPPMLEIWSRRFLWEGNDKYSCLENSIERGSRQATIHGVTNSWIWLNNSYFHFSPRV